MSSTIKPRGVANKGLHYCSRCGKRGRSSQAIEMHIKDLHKGKGEAMLEPSRADLVLNNMAMRARIEDLEKSLKYADEYLTILQTPNSEPLNSLNASRTKAERSQWAAHVRNEAREIWAVIGNVIHHGRTFDAAMAEIKKDKS